MLGAYIAASGAYCADHPNASSCSINSVGSEVVAILIGVAIVALAIFGLWWRYGNKESGGQLARIFYAVARRLGRRNSR